MKDRALGGGNCEAQFHYPPWTVDSSAASLSGALSVELQTLGLSSKLAFTYQERTDAEGQVVYVKSRVPAFWATALACRAGLLV